MIDTKRIRLEDKRFDSDVYDKSYANSVFVRVGAKERKFSKVDFKYCIFENAYFRNCTFISCDFTGCRFTAAQFHGSTFALCAFDYATFERTYIDQQILESESPRMENVRSRFARTLRMNYQQIGDAKAVNLAMRVELDATELHLRKSWLSQESYFRRKYVGLNRAAMFLSWLQFKLLDLLWGNGESLLKLARSMGILLCVIMFYDVWKTKAHGQVASYWVGIIDAPQVFFGVLSPDGFSKLILACVVALRLMTFGLFVSLIVKRYNRR